MVDGGSREAWSLEGTDMNYAAINFFKIIGWTIPSTSTSRNYYHRTGQEMDMISHNNYHLTGPEMEDMLHTSDIDML